MSCFFKFNEDDVFVNRIKTHPSYQFYIYSGSLYYNSEYSLEGTYARKIVIDEAITLPTPQTMELDGPIYNASTITVETGATLTINDDITPDDNPVRHMPSGHISLYELNIDRDATAASNIKKLNTIGLDQSTNLIYPFITKKGSFASFRTVTTKEFNEDFKYGDILTGSYPLTATLVRDYFAEGPDREPNPMEPSIYGQTTIIVDDPVKVIDSAKTITDSPTLTKPNVVALKTTLDKYTHLSDHYAYSTASLPNSLTVNWSKGDQELNLISIPSIYYGSSIKKGTVDLKFYYTGSLIGQLKDENQNGELIQVGPSGSGGSGSVAGVVLYNEGFLLLTGSWNISSSLNSGYDNTKYKGTSAGNFPSRWVYFGAGMSQEIDNGISSSSFAIAFSGTNHVPTITMMAHAKRGDLNWSNNPTYIKYGEPTGSITGSVVYKENFYVDIKNTVSSSYECGHTASFRKQTFINKVGIYDKDKNLIGIAKVSTPVRKLETDEYTFKLKVDI